mmetsp:Transcript_133403/g.266157  ORF Transcript_133403/g.266157 Transcript_133403/m.266157 type:complete len:80 (-) Transcript_133403:642-881(-)
MQKSLGGKVSFVSKSYTPPPFLSSHSLGDLLPLMVIVLISSISHMKDIRKIRTWPIIQVMKMSSRPAARKAAWRGNMSK